MTLFTCFGMVTTSYQKAGVLADTGLFRMFPYAAQAAAPMVTVMPPAAFSTGVYGMAATVTWLM